MTTPLVCCIDCNDHPAEGDDAVWSTLVVSGFNEFRHLPDGGVTERLPSVRTTRAFCTHSLMESGATLRRRVASRTRTAPGWAKNSRLGDCPRSLPLRTTATFHSVGSGIGQNCLSPCKVDERGTYNRFMRMAKATAWILLPAPSFRQQFVTW